MKFKNLVSGKEVVDAKAGDILILKDKQTCEEVVYMIVRQYNWYNLINLLDGGTFFAHFKPLDDIRPRIRKWFDLTGVIENEYLELSMLEEYKKAKEYISWIIEEMEE